jgi:hypothetical protein
MFWGDMVVVNLFFCFRKLGATCGLPGLCENCAAGVIFSSLHEYCFRRLPLASINRMGNLPTDRKYTPEGNHRLITVVTFIHVKGLLNFPAYCQHIAATNPCPCSWINEAQKVCGCAPAVATKYAATSILYSGKHGGKGTF